MSIDVLQMIWREYLSQVSRLSLVIPEWYIRVVHYLHVRTMQGVSDTNPRGALKVELNWLFIDSLCPRHHGGNVLDYVLLRAHDHDVILRSDERVRRKVRCSTTYRLIVHRKVCAC